MTSRFPGNAFHDWTKVAKRHKWVRAVGADVSVVIMTSHSSWIKSSNWTNVIPQSALLLWGHNPPYYYAVLVDQILVNACAPHYQSGFMQVTAPDDFKLGVESWAPVIASFGLKRTVRHYKAIEFNIEILLNINNFQFCGAPVRQPWKPRPAKNTNQCLPLISVQLRVVLEQYPGTHTYTLTNMAHAHTYIHTPKVIWKGQYARTTGGELFWWRFFFFWWRVVLVGSCIVYGGECRSCPHWRKSGGGGGVVG